MIMPVAYGRAYTPSRQSSGVSRTGTSVLKVNFFPSQGVVLRYMQNCSLSLVNCYLIGLNSDFISVECMILFGLVKIRGVAALHWSPGK